MKIPDLLSPNDVMIDVKASNKRQLLQDSRPGPRPSQASVPIRSHPIFSSAKNWDRRESARAWRSRMRGCPIWSGLAGSLPD